ncbi:hydrolase, partial [Escherichia coli]|nr:hydrolase [Escherichia coli]
MRLFGNGARMDLQHWQAQFENWLKNHHQHQDAAL